MPALRSIIDIINLKTLIVTILAVISTSICITYDLTADFPLTLIATAVVFPIVFSINGAYKRREAALREYGSIKAHGKAIYFVTRDWLVDPSEHTLSLAKTKLGQLLASCRDLLTDEHTNFRDKEERVYQRFSELSYFIKTELRGNGLASGEVSRTNQYLSKMFTSFENLKHIYQYRTPQTLRMFSNFFVIILPIIYGPYFAHEARDAKGLADILPVLFSVILQTS